MMLVMIKGSVSDETLPVNASIPVLKKKTPSKEQRKRTSRVDTELLKYSPSG